MELMDQEIIEQCIAEFREHIEDANHNILILEKTPEDTEHVDALFRNFHTIKGNASMLGFEKIIRLTHETETLLDNIREQTVEINQEIIETLLMSADVLSALVDEIEDKTPVDEHELNDLINTISNYLPPKSLPQKVEENQLSSNDPLDLYLQIVDEASGVFDQIILLAMSGSFNNNILQDINEKAAKLSRSIKDAVCPQASNLLDIFLGYMKITKTHSLPFSENNFGVFKDLFLVFIDNLAAEIGGLLGIRLVTWTAIERKDELHPIHENSSKTNKTPASCAIIDLRESKNWDKNSRIHAEKTIKNVCKAYDNVALIDPFKGAVIDSDTPGFDSPLEALHYTIKSIQKASSTANNSS